MMGCWVQMLMSPCLRVWGVLIFGVDAVSGSLTVTKDTGSVDILENRSSRSMMVR